MLLNQIDNNQRSLSLNQRKLLNLIRQNQPVKRSDLTTLTNLTQQSIHRIVASLEDEGLVRATPQLNSNPGKPSPALELVNNARHGIGVLVNTDSVVICIADLACSAQITQQLSIDISDRHAALDQVQKHITSLLEKNNIASKSICGIGFTLPGFFISNKNMFNAPEPLRDWSLVDLQAELHSRFELPVFLENSANAGAVGETLGPIGKKYSDFVYLGFDYGFGGAIVIDGKLYSGRAGNAGELSSIYVGDEMNERPAMGLLLEHMIAQGVPLTGIDDLKRNFDADWPGVNEWIDKTVPHLDRLVIALTGILDPQAIVFGGQIAPKLATILMRRVRFPKRFRYDTPPPLPDLVAGAAVDNPAAIGIAQLPLKEIFFQ